MTRIAKRGRGGFITWVALIVVALIVLGFYGFDLKEYLDAPSIKENFSAIWGWTVSAWHWLVETLKSFLPNR